MKQSIDVLPRRSFAVLAQVGLLAGPFLSILDSNIVNVVLPAIAAQLHTSLDTVQWVESGYLLALAAVLAASAFLAKRFGTRRVYLVSLLGFTLTSALCALAPTIGLLIVARALQGALAAPLVPLAMGMLYGRRERGSGISPLAGMMLFLAPALGPTIGGLLIPIAGWQSIFLINVPFGILGAVGILRIPEHIATQSNRDARLDPVGIVLLAGGLVLTIYGAMQGASVGWMVLATWPYVVGGVVLLIAYILWALRTAHPAVDIKLLRRGQTALAVGLCALTSVVLFVMLFLLPIFMENLQDFSPLMAGLVLLPQGIITGFGTVFGSRLSKRKGVRFCAVLGMAILTVCTAALLLVESNTPAWLTAIILSGRGLALGLTIQPLLNTMLRSLSREEMPDGNTLFNVAERLGGSVGIPLVATFFTVRESARIGDVLNAFGLHITTGNQSGSLSALAGRLPAPLFAQLTQAATAGFHDTIWLIVAISALGMCAALLLRDKAAMSPDDVRSVSLEHAH